jgi:membrane protease YdiL (CAAX protease family)
MASNDRLAAQLRSFGPIGILAIVVVLAGLAVTPLLGAIFVLVWVRLSRTPWRAIGFAPPKNWPAVIVIGIALGMAFKLLMKAVVMPLLGADAINQAYHYLAGNTAALPGILFTVIVSAAFGEEVVFRGYSFERLGRLLGSGRWAKIFIVVFTSTLFGLAHYGGQGLAGAQQAAIVGSVFATIFAVTGRLWMLIIAHAAFDVTATFIIYWDLETHMAHLIFK